jgi:ectoine hydroxylase-related dioxygenase (phytanoyl-CoA dioxygenase family)
VLRVARMAKEPAMVVLDATATTVAEVVAALNQDGFAIVQGVLSRDEVRAKRAELTAILESIPTGRNAFEGFTTRRIYALFARTRAFDAPATHPLVLGVLDQVLGQYQLSAPVGIEISPGEVAQTLHRDDGVYPVTRPHTELVVNTMWALDDFTEENGATHVVPGSHTWISERPGLETATVRAVMPAGSVMFFLGDVFHGGGANRSARPRLGVILEYAVGWVRPQENHILGVPKAIVRTLPERLQELLGYNIYGKLLGNVDGRHPRKYLNE